MHLDTMFTAANGARGVVAAPLADELGGEPPVLYFVTKPNGEPYRWSDLCEGWAKYPIVLRRESDACDMAERLAEIFGAASVYTLDGPCANRYEKIPERMDSLDIQLALWIAESTARGEVV